MNPEELSQKKEQLETEKLEEELLELRRPTYWRLGTYLSALPTLLALFALFQAWNTGYFDKERVLLAIDKANLQRDLKNLGEHKDSLGHLNDSLMNEIVAQRRKLRLILQPRDELLRAMNRQTRLWDSIVVLDKFILLHKKDAPYDSLRPRIFKLADLKKEYDTNRKLIHGISYHIDSVLTLKPAHP